LIRISSILTRREARPCLEFKRGAGAAFVVVGVALMGAFAMMDALLVEWRAREAAAPAVLSVRMSVPGSEIPRLEKPGDVRILASVAMVKDSFSNAGYSLDAVRRGQVAVPRLLHASLPYDLKSVARVADRKAVFLRFMLPYVLLANLRVREQREKLLAMRRKIGDGETVQPADKAWLDALFDEYRVKPGNFAALDLRVGTVPPSLALAQSAVESGWGTSRFANEGNAPFGQWTTAAYRGLVPKARDAGKTHKVRAFDDLAESVNSYLRNLNTHRAYREFRQQRAALRARNASIDSVAIAATLASYSQEGEAYVALVRRVITGNSLRALDNARLSDTVMLFGPGA
jgi:Bax protein